VARRNKRRTKSAKNTVFFENAEIKQIQTHSDQPIITKELVGNINSSKSTSNENTRKGSNTGIYISFVGILIILLLISGGINLGNNFGSNNQNSNNFFNNENQNAGISSLDAVCMHHGAVGLHYHYSIEIIYNGQYLSIPSDIGISPNCMKPLHTHDSSGTVHVEIPSDYNGQQPNIEDFLVILIEDHPVLFGSLNLYDIEFVTVNVDNATINYIPSDGDKVTVSMSY
jgi:hypothetical protein